MKREIRTDLAIEARELWQESAEDTTKLRGVEAYEEDQGSFKVSTVKILNKEGEEALGKPVGSYITLELDGLIRREENAFSDAAHLVSQELKPLLQLQEDDTVLIVGLGNAAVTPDAVGPGAVQCIMVTRHLVERMPDQFADFRRVSAIQTGVLGTTGMESASIISAIVDFLRPDRMIVVDALASRRMDRLCRTLQLSDTGIIPGSGVGNSRAALNRATLGVPVIAVGVPTVVDAATLAIEIAERAGLTEKEIRKLSLETGMIVTPRNIDKSVSDVSKLIGYGINLSLHEGLSVEDVDMFIS